MFYFLFHSFSLVKFIFSYNFYLILVTFGAFIKLYLLIALHCGVSSELSKTVLNIFQQKPQARVQLPRQEPRVEVRAEARTEDRSPSDYGNLNQKLVNELKADTSKSREQKLLEINKLRAQHDRAALTLEEMVEKYKLGGKRSK